MSLGMQFGVDLVKEAFFGPITKASLEFCDEKGNVEKSIQCGFNPTEYSVSKSLGYYADTGLNQPFAMKDLKYMRGEPSTLSVNILVDDTIMAGSVVKYGAKIYTAIRTSNNLKTPKTVKEVCQLLEGFMHNDSKTKTTPYIAFNWGEMRFIGKLRSYNAQFIMFDRSGDPTRAKIGMQIIGEDTYFLEKPSLLASGSTGKSDARKQGEQSGKMNIRKLIGEALKISI